MYFAKLAAALFLLFALTAPCRAQNNKQIIAGTFYEDRASSFSSTGNIFLAFAQTPIGQLLNITNVACDIQLTANQALARVELNAGTTAGNTDLGRNYPIRAISSPEVASNGDRYYTIVTNQIYYKFGPGRFPTISVTSSGSQYVSANCIIIGNLSDN